MRRYSTILLCLLFLVTSILSAQTFVLVTDTNNPVFTSANCQTANNTNFNCFQGSAWIDLNQDYRLDLFVAGRVFLNQGNEQFTESGSIDLSGFDTRSSSVSFMDFDNDGDKDLLFYNGGGYGTKIFENNGQGVLNSFPSILDSINSTVWSAQWCDYNIDAHADIILTFADGFAGGLRLPNRLFKGSATNQFSQVQNTWEFLNALHPYTVSYWIDYDEDGDQDLFIASGPANGSSAPDFLYKNLIKETGTEGFQRITQPSYASTPQDGQCYNFIDADNDGDFDLCITNWRSAPNRFYENDSGSFVLRTTPFTSSANGQYLSNAWGDLDNDGDLDVLLTSTQTTRAKYFLNNGDGTFVDGGDIGTIVNGPTSGISLGDYNNDGKLDFFVTGGVKGLFKNTTSNANTYVAFSLVGNPNHKSPVGARVHVKATINGKSTLLKREVSTQNTFMGHNSQRVHFGLGNATQVDSLIIYWPSGSVDKYQNLNSGHLYTVEEGQQPFIVILPPIGLQASIIDNTIFEVFPNPAQDSFNIELNKADLTDFKVALISLNGKVLFSKEVVHSNSVTIESASIVPGSYILQVTTGNQRVNQKLTIH